MEKSVEKRRMRSSITTTTRLRSIDGIISDDELIEILHRLPLDCVHRCKCVSKRWLNIISQPMFKDSFIRLRTNSAERLNPERHDDFLLYQVQQQWRASFTPIKHAELKPYSEYSPKTKYFDLSLGFLPILQYRKRLHIHDQLCSCTYDLRPRTDALRFFNLLRVYKGLLLCEAGFSYMSNILYVCDPLTKQWLELPPSPWSSDHRPTQGGSVGFLCDESVVSIIHLTGVRGHFSLDVFTTKAGGAIGEWRQICTPFMPDFRWAGNIEVVVCNGRFHWNGKTSIVVYDPLTNPSLCDTISIPIETTKFSNYSYHMIPRLAVSDGCLRIYRHGNFDNSGHEVLIWDLVDYDKREWSSKYKISPGRNSYFKGFSETNRSAFYISPKRDDPNVMIRYMTMDGNGSTCKWIVRQKHPHKHGTRLFPYVMTLWPVSLRNFFNLTSTTREQEP